MTTEQTTQMPGSPPSPSSAFWQRFRDLDSLRRSRDRRALAGVAEGLSRHFNVDRIIVRVLFVALTFFGGAGIILYVALWLTVPRDDAFHSIVSGRRDRNPGSVITAGLAIGGVGAAVAFLCSLSWAVPHPFPSLLVIVAVALLAVALARRGDGRWNSPAPAPGGPTPQTPPFGGPTPQTPLGGPTPPPWTPAPSAETPTAAPTGAEPTARLTTEPTARLIAEPKETDTPSASEHPTAWWQRDDLPPTTTFPPIAVPPPPPPPPARPRSHLFALTMATTALAIAGLWIADATTSFDPDPSVYPGVVLGIVAAALLVSAWWGRSRGLIAIGIIASVVTAGAAFVGPGPYGDFAHAPTAAGHLRPSYSMGVGQLTLGLEKVVDIEDLNGRSTTLDARIGRIVVIIPSSVAVSVDATVDHGEIDGVPRFQDTGRGGVHAVLAPPSDGRPAMNVTIHLKFGQIQIERAACPGAGAPGIGEATTLWKGDTHVAAACN